MGPGIFFSARLVVRFPFSHRDNPRDGARLNAFKGDVGVFVFASIISSFELLIGEEA